MHSLVYTFPRVLVSLCSVRVGLLWVTCGFSTLGDACPHTWSVPLSACVSLDWEVFLARLLDPELKAYILVVIITPALWKSLACLREICTAADNKVKIYPMFFEGPVPPKREIWPVPEKYTMEERAKHVLMVEKAREGLYRANCFPPPNEFESGIAKNPHHLERAVAEVEEMLRAARFERGGGGY